QTFTELCIFQVKSRRRDSLRKLPSIRVRIAPPAMGDLILMIGRGSSEKPGVNEWIQDGKKRWGFNIVSHTARTPFANFFGETHGYFTEFGNGLFDCQGASGDSGGAAFYYDSLRREWQLAGMLTAVTTPVHERRTHRGDSTFIAGLQPMKYEPARVSEARLGANAASHQGVLAKR
ncbi:MAG: hypothetical protein AAGH89_10635, partial [Verrucomicrobiota bacterium]